MATRKVEKKAEQRRISQIGDFKNRLGGVTELPSGLIVKVRNPGGLRAFMATGTIPNSLMAIIQKGLDTGKAPAADELVKGGKIDPQLMEDMVTLLDHIAVSTIVEPKIYPRLTEVDLAKWNKEHPDNQLEDIEDLRSDEQLYADELPDDDKQFLFQWVSGGTRDLEEFRNKLANNVGAVAAVSGNAGTPQSDSGTNAR
jgi:hypothetical protein